MNCLKAKEKIVQYMEDLLPGEEKKRMDAHLMTCSECRGELEAISEIRSRLLHAGSASKSADFEYKVIDRIILEQNRKLRRAGGLRRRLGNWRLAMKSRTAKLSAAATVAIALIFGIGIFTNVPPIATADTFLTQALDALSGLSSIHMKARMRSRLGDNFGSICLDCDFVPVEMWKQLDDAGTLRWRLEKPRRTIVMDGESTTMIVGGKWAVKIEETCKLGGGFDSWMGRLLDVRALLDSELQQATENPVRQLLLNHEEINGKDKILLEVDVTTEVPENDVCRDSMLQNADHLKVYRFDAETKLLEGFQVFVVSEGREVLVFEITEIDYDAHIDSGLLALELPDDINWVQEPEILPKNDVYRDMTAAEAATAFLQAIADNNREEVLKFWPYSRIGEAQIDGMGLIESFSIETPFQSESGYVGWIIPYEAKLKDGRIVTGSLSMRNDNEAGRFVFDGSNEEIK